MMDDNRIQTITAPEQLFDTELLLDVFDEENPPEEQARLVSVMSIKARMLGVYKEFATTIKAFQKAQQKLANEYQRINAKQNGGMILDFASDGKPLATIDNFVQVIENDSKFDNLRFNLLTESPEKIIDGKADRRQTLGTTTFEFDSFSVLTGGVQTVLPQKEFLLLYKLVSSPGHIFTRQQLMDDIWGIDTHTDPRTVDVHINRLRDRFRENQDFEIITVRGIGYKAERKYEEG